MDGCISHTSVIRYDAMNELSGQQSSTVALLDERQTGVVISSILHRDQARLYVKRVQDGNPEYELSPEEQQAVEAAMAARLTPPRKLGLRGGLASPTSAPRGPTATRRCGRRRRRHRGGPVPHIYDAVMAVQDGGADRAVVPIENALEGSVAVTLDTLTVEADRRPDPGRGRAPDPPLRARRAARCRCRA